MRWVLSLLVASAFGLTIALTRAPEPADLRVGYTAIETLDPQLVSSTEDVRITYALFEGLTTFDEKFRIQPGVAKSWTASEDRKTYTFHLRDDAKWSNGDPVTANDFTYSWRIAMMSDTSPRYINFLWHIRGAKAFYDWCATSLADIQGLEKELENCRQERDGTLKLDEEETQKRAARWERLRKQLPPDWVSMLTKARTGVGSAIEKAQLMLEAQQKTMGEKRFEDSLVQFEKRVGVKAIDDHTLEVKLEKALPYFLEVAACWPLMPVHRPTIEAHSRIDPSSFRYRRDPQWTKPKTIVGNGPFKLNLWRFKRQVHMVANEHYWNAESVKLRAVRLDHFKSPQTMFIAYERGQLDLYLDASTLNFSPELIARQRDGQRKDVHELSGYGTYYYLINCRPMRPDGTANPFADVNVRRAFVMSVDRKALVEQVTRLHQETTSVFVPPNAIPGYEPPDGLPYDLEKARTAMAEAGYPSGRGFPSFELTYNTGSNHQPVAEALNKMWTDNLGVKTDLQGQEWSVFQQRRKNGNYAIARAGWFGDYIDPTTFLELFKTGDGNNDSGFSDPHYDQLLEKAATERDPTKRLALLKEAERYVMVDQCVVLALYHYKMVHLYNPDRLKGVSLHSRNQQLYHRMETVRP